MITVCGVWVLGTREQKNNQLISIRNAVTQRKLIYN
jgi:hypothetical protein